MAYQPKSYRKFVATAATATLVASAVAPVAFAANFSDVPASYKDAVDFVVSKGANGTSATTFGTQQEITRVDAAVLLANVLGLDTKAASAGFTDVPERAQGAVNALKAAGITNGKTTTSFGTGNITRGELAIWIQKGFKLQGDATLAFTDVKESYAAAVKALVANKITNGVSATQFGVAQTAKRGDFAKFLFAASKVEATPETGTPEIVSVSAINLKEIEVKFGVAVDISNISEVVTAVGATTNLLDTTATRLSSDGKTLTLVATSNLTNDAFYNVALSGVVTDGELEPIAPYSTSIKVSDKLAPAVKTVSAVTKDTETNTFTITFTEPVLLDLVKVGDVVASATPNATNKTYTITLPPSANKLEVGKSYNITINGLRDLAGNFATASTTTSVSVERDAVKPEFTLKPLNPKQFDVVFNEDMNEDVAVDSFIVKNADGVVLNQAALAQPLSDGKTFRVTLQNSPIAADKTTAELSVSVKTVSDLAGNYVTAKTDKVTLSKETVKPEMTSVRVLPGTNNKLEVTFSEKVTDLDASDFVLTGPNSTNVTLSAFTGATTDGYNKYVLTTSAALPANGEYNLVLFVDSVVDTSSNKNAAKSLKFSYNGLTAPAVTATISTDTDLNGVEGNTASSNQSVVVKFTRTDIINGKSASTGDFKDGAADNLANYSLNGASLPAGTTVTFIDALDADMDGVVSAGEATGTPRAFDAVKINFTAVDANSKATALKQGGKIVLTASNVKSAAGSTIPYASAELTVLDATAPTVSSAYLTGDVSTGDLKLTVQFSEEVSLPALLTDTNDDLIVTGLTSTSTAATISLSTVGYLGTDKTKVVFNVTSTDVDVTKAVKLYTNIAANINLVDGSTNALTPIIGADAITVTNYATN